MLTSAFDTSAGHLHPDRQFAIALGLRMPALATLESRIYADLDTSVYGIHWWAPHPGTSRRILISDHLVQCGDTVRTNLVAARLHLMELFRWWDIEGRFMERAIAIDPVAGPFVKSPPFTDGVDYLHVAMADLHLAGFFQALFSAFDCFAAVMVGVLALPIDIVRADLESVRRSIPTAATTPGQQLQIDFWASWQALIARIGSPGWLAWMFDYRNLMAHRGRRTLMSSVRPRMTADGRWTGLADVTRFLARDPHLSEVEALLLFATTYLWLGDEAETSLHWAFDGTVALVEEASIELARSWDRRRQNPALLTQPRQQWPAGARPSKGFRGTGLRLPTEPDSITLAPSRIKRLLAAALDSQGRRRWRAFD